MYFNKFAMIFGPRVPTVSIASFVILFWSGDLQVFMWFEPTVSDFSVGGFSSVLWNIFWVCYRCIDHFYFLFIFYYIFLPYLNWFTFKCQAAFGWFCIFASQIIYFSEHWFCVFCVDVLPFQFQLFSFPVFIYQF
jgi:hypothetical protein